LAGSLISGTNATYTITVHNDGPDDAEGPIIIVDELPTGLTFVSAGGTGWSCAHDLQDVACLRTTSLANGATTAITVVARVTAASGTRLTNDAAVLSTSVDNDLTDNEATATATVITSAVAGANGLPRTGTRIDDLTRLGLLIAGFGLIAWSTGTLQLLRALPIRRRF
jgi:uncharacterized repeat protein (TIGR01451 family)